MLLYDQIPFTSAAVLVFFNDLIILYNCVFFCFFFYFSCVSILMHSVTHIQLSCTILLHTSLTKSHKYQCS